MTKKEKIIVFLYSFFLILVLASPYFYGALITPKEKIFTWTTFNYPSDYNAYQAWVSQYSQGKTLAKILYTTENHPALFFHPLFFLAGKINQWLTIPSEIIFLIFSLLSNFLLLLVIYHFISYFLPCFSSRLLSFIFISLAGGLGWLLGLKSVDYLAELTLFGICSWSFILSLSLALLLKALLFFIQSFENNGWKKIIWGGICLFFLGWIHPYDLLIFFPLAFFYLLFFTKFLKGLKNLLLIFFFCLPPILYYWLLNQSHWVWRQNSSLITNFYSPLNYFWGLFPFIFLALFSLKTALKDKKLKIVIFFAFIQFLLVCLPVSLQWKLSLGIFVYFGILAGLTLDKLFQTINKKWLKISPSPVFLVFIIFLSSLTNILTLTTTFQVFQKQDYPYYLNKEIKEGFDWLKTETSSNEAIFSSFEMGNFIPRYSGNRVFAGHWAQTIGASKKRRLIENFFKEKISDEEIKKIFKDNNIKYIFYSDSEKKIGERDLSRFGQEVFKNNKVSIFEVNDL